LTLIRNKKATFDFNFHSIDELKCAICFKGSSMRAIKKIKRIIEQNPQDKASQIFSRLITCLAEEADFSLKELYELNSNEFELAIEVLEEWRLDRFYMGKAKVFDVAQQALEMGSSGK
jgi:hypothetical protein